MEGPKRNPDKLNTMGVVVIGICSAVMVYVTIVALEAFYVNDTSEVQTMADYGGQDITAKGHKADEMRNVTDAARNPASPGAPETYRIPIDKTKEWPVGAIQLVIESAKQDPAHLIPALPRSDKATIQPIFGRPKLIAAPPTPAPAAGTDAGSGAAPAAGSGAAAAPAAGTGTSAAPMTSTGSPGALDRVPGSGGKAMPNPPTRSPTPPGAHAP